jgi:hypothetical protein
MYSIILRIFILANKMLLSAHVMGETRKDSSYPQLASYHLNLPMMKESQNDERYQIRVKKSMTKREDRNQLHKVHGRSY